MTKDYRSTLRGHAFHLSNLGKAYTQLASRHRVVASALERGRLTQVTHGSHFDDWIFKACEFSAEAERLLALEIELARGFGVTWQEVASALGISRQAAWDRFADQARWQKSRRVSQLQSARRAELLRELRNRIEGSEDELRALEEWLGQRPNRQSGPG